MLKIMQRFVLPEQGVMLVGPSGREEVQLRHLTEQGFQNILGYLEGGFHRWRDAGHPIDVLISLSAEEAALDLAHAKPPPSIVDIRSESAYNRGHIKHAHCMPLEKLLEDWDVLDPAKPYYMYCSDGVLSATVVSWLKLHGRPLIQHIYGGLEALQAQGVELVR